MTTSSSSPYHPAKTAPLRAVPMGLGDALNKFFEVSNQRGVILLALNYTILAFNVAAEGILSHVSTRRWERGTSLSDYVAPEALIQYRTCFDQTIATGTPQRFERTYTTQRGPIWLEIYFEPFFDNQGKVEMVGMFIRNMTAYREAIATVQTTSDHYRNLLDYAPQAILVVGKEKILYANMAAARLLGTTPAALNYADWQTSLRTRTNSPLARLLQSDISQNQSAITVEDQLHCFDGQILDAIIHTFATQYNGTPAIQLVLVNVSEHKRSEAILRANAQYFRNMIEYSNDLISLIDASGILLYVSPSVKRTLGYDEHEMVGRNVLDFIHPSDTPTVLSELNALLHKPGGVVSNTSRMIHRNEQWIWVEAVGKNALNDPDFRAIIINFRDIHERKMAETRLQQQLYAQTILREVTTLMSESLNLDELLNQFAEQMARVTKVHYVWIATLERTDTNHALVRAEYRSSVAAASVPVRLLGNRLSLKNHFPYGDAFINNHPIRAVMVKKNNPQLDTISLNLFEEYGATTLLLIPLLFQDQLLAFSALWDSSDREFLPEEIELCEQLAHQAVIAIHNADLYSRAQQEISERKRIENALRASEERYSLAVMGANDGIWDWDLRTDEMYFSPRWKAMLGYDEHEIRHEPNQWFARIHPRDIESLRITLNKHLHAETEHFEAEYRMWHRDGSVLWVLSRGLAIYNEYGQPYRIAGSQTDITTRKQTEERIHYEAFHDNLTDLPNRTYFISRLGEVISLYRQESGNPCSVLFINLDRFKMINDSLGHYVGDQVLIQMAQRLENTLRTGDVVARMGGDEFAILLHDADHNHDIEGFVTRLQHELQHPFIINGHEIFLSASIGIVRHDVRYIQAEEILRNADIAMQEAKIKGKARVQFFETSMHHRAVIRLQVENDLRRAIEHGDFELYYQPIINLKTGEIGGLEALARWKHPTKGFISPTEFIPVAEESGLIVALGRWILNEALTQLYQWRTHHPDYANLTVSVNLSVEQMIQSDIVTDVIQAIEHSGMAPSSLKLELTESIMLDQTADALHPLNYLHRYGVEMQLDDFGVGYSSLSRLHMLPISTIKIDRTFIKDLLDRTEPTAIIKTILTLARALDKQVIAEGIETAQQLHLLRSLETDAAQGYYFSRPLPPAHISKLLARHQRFSPA